MKHTKRANLCLSVFTAVTTLGVASTAEASFYPPGYTVEHTCRTEGPVEVCTSNHHYGNFPRFQVRYKGYLGQENISAWVKLNGRSGTFDFSEEGVLALNVPNPYLCWVGGMPEGHEGPYPACKQEHGEPTGYLLWETSPIPQEEKDLFFYARNEFGVANAWDIEVAVVGANGEWDSRFGQNYRFRFE